LNKKFDPSELRAISKFNPEDVISAIYYEGEKKCTLIKRFQIETTTTDQRFSFLTEHKSTQLLFVSLEPNPVVTFTYRSLKGKEHEEVEIASFIDIKGWKALGNKLKEEKIKILGHKTSSPVEITEGKNPLVSGKSPSDAPSKHTGDSTQGTLFD